MSLPNADGLRTRSTCVVTARARRSTSARLEWPITRTTSSRSRARSVSLRSSSVGVWAGSAAVRRPSLRRRSRQHRRRLALGVGPEPAAARGGGLRGHRLARYDDLAREAREAAGGPRAPGIRGALAAAARGDVRVDDRAVFADGPIDRSRRRADSAVRGAVVVIEHAGHVVAGLLVRWDSSVCEHRFLARVVRRQRQGQIVPETLDQPTKVPNAAVDILLRVET